MMPLKEYQTESVDLFEKWYLMLYKKMNEVNKLKKKITHLELDIAEQMINYPRQAWDEITGKKRYVDRMDRDGNFIPHVCFKVPTSGGKTLIAAATLKRIKVQFGLVLWIVPTTAIYDQTIRNLKDKSCLVRQFLDSVSNNRVLIKEKDDVLTKTELKKYLCVMILMKQGAHRKKGNADSEPFLKMRRDSGIYQGFFPDSDDEARLKKLLKSHPSLDMIPGMRYPKHSLLNIFRMVHPIIILDEAHKTSGMSRSKIKKKCSGEKELKKTISYVNDMNPRLVIELSATPNQSFSNILVNVGGRKLKNEEMIKLPINLNVLTQGTSWKNILDMAIDNQEKLDNVVEQYRTQYIRPIMIIRVERTSSDSKNKKKDQKLIHADDVEKYLIEKNGIEKNQIAIKTAEKDELKGINLESDNIPIRYIITKNALQEGWDSPFAYTLVILDNLTSPTAVTQMIGRVLRQPCQKYTNRKELNQCYVYCRSDETRKVAEYVKEALEIEGLEEISNQMIQTNGTESMNEIETTQKLRMRKSFVNVYLPKVMHLDSNDWIELDYERHILAEINWDKIHSPQMTNLRTKDFLKTYQIDIDDINPGDIGEIISVDTFSIYDMINGISDAVPNMWQGSRIVHEAIKKLKKNGMSDNEIYNARQLVILKIIEHVCDKVIKQSEVIFKRKINANKIHFNLEVEKYNFKVKKEYDISLKGSDVSLQERTILPVQRSLFEPVDETHFDSKPEKDFALQLDEVKAIKWWHRVAMKNNGEFYLRGWKRDRIWPDFVVMLETVKKNKKLHIYEIKGEHLKNPDTEYKEKVLTILQDAFNKYANKKCRTGQGRGTIRIKNGHPKGEFKMLFDQSIGNELSVLNRN